MSNATLEETARLDEVREFALAKFAEHGLTDWTFGFDRAVRRFGHCVYGTKRITLSIPLILKNPEAIWQDVVLHEIAHALAPLGARHGAQWREIALSIGCTGKRLVTLTRDAVEPHTFVGVCPQGHKTSGYRRTKAKCASCVRFNPSNSDFAWSRVTDVSVLPKRPMKQVRDPRAAKFYIGECPGCEQRTEGGTRRRNIACGKCSPGVFNERFRFVWTEEVNTLTFAELVRAAVEKNATHPDGFATEVALQVIADRHHGDEELFAGFVSDVVERSLAMFIPYVLDSRGTDPSSVPTRAECESWRIRDKISHAAKLVRSDAAAAVKQFLEVVTQRAA